MYNKIEKWLNDVFEKKMPLGVVAVCFNLYEDENDSWSMELVGTKNFDVEDSDWACDEVTDFGTRDASLLWEKEADWAEILEDVIGALKRYLESGQHTAFLKAFAGVGVGFVDGDLEILYVK